MQYAENLQIEFTCPVSSFDKQRLLMLVDRATTLKHIKLRKVHREGRSFVTSERNGRLGLNLALRDLRRYLERHDIFMDVKSVVPVKNVGAVWTVVIKKL